MAGVEDQPGQDARGEPGGEEGEPGLSGLHVSLAPRSVRSRDAIFARGAVEEGVAAGAGPAYRDDRSSSGVYADTAPDRAAESAPERVGELLLAGVPEQGVPEHQLARRLPAGESL